METLESAAGFFRGHPVLRAGFAAAAALAMVVTPFEAMDADPIEEEVESIRNYNEPCSSGCNTSNEICCQDPIG